LDQLREWYRKNRDNRKNIRNGTLFFVPPPGYQLGRLDITRLFDFREPGEYIIQVTMCLDWHDQDGTFHQVFLPKTSTKMRIGERDMSRME
jgi:hypothetical protein